MVLSSGAAGAVDISVLAGMGVVSGVRDVAPAFERATGHKAIVSFEVGPLLMQKVNAGTPADSGHALSRCDRRSHQAGQGGGQPR